MMMFLLRCAFWLSVVYGSIFWQGGRLRELPAVAVEVERSAVQQVTQTAMSTVAAHCRTDPARCIADAARLTALIDAGKLEPADDGRAPRVVAQDPGPAQVPLPIPRPRGVMLTRGP